MQQILCLDERDILCYKVVLLSIDRRFGALLFIMFQIWTVYLGRCPIQIVHGKAKTNAVFAIDHKPNHRELDDDRTRFLLLFCPTKMLTPAHFVILPREEEELKEESQRPRPALPKVRPRRDPPPQNISTFLTGISTDLSPPQV
ncbi:hypothetical protein Bca4012_080758 [Brassica carinata]|uniref:(rape) hypothetical protein n=1 Tax=Brassica napus TaxID=3708 RepID=A0A816MZU2_BRANA|nr:unnamed protein product [Brassica napus]